MKSTIVITLIFFTLSLYAQLPLPPDEHYDAVYLKLIKEYTLNSDGSMDFRYIKKQKLQTYRAYHNLYGETFVVYNPGYQSLKINETYTIMADGKKITSPKNAFNEVLPGFAANAPAYNDLREMVITHTGLEINAEINLDYQVTTLKGKLPALMGNELLSEPEPVKELIVRVRIPAGQNLYYQLFNAEYQPEKTTEGDYLVYSWKLSNVPAISSEEAQKGGNELYPRLIFSSLNNLDKTLEFLTAQPAYQCLSAEPIEKYITNINSRINDKFELVLKLQEKVINDVRTYPIPFRYCGFKSRTAEQVWNSNGGTVPEKAILLTTLLKTAGIEAEPFIVCKSIFSNSKIGTLLDIEDFGVRVELKEQGTLFLSANSLNYQNLKYTLPDRTFIVLRPGERPDILISGIPKGKIAVQGTFLVSSDPKLTGEISMNLVGGANPFLAVSKDKNKIKNSVIGSLKSGDLAEIKVSDITPETAFQTFTVQSEKPFRKDTNFYYFTLPSVNSGIESWNVKTLSVKRETTYEIPMLIEESYSYSLALPVTLVLFSPEIKINLSNPAGTYIFEVKQDAGKIVIRREIRFRERIISPERYADYKILMDKWNNPRYRELVFKEKK